MDNNPVGRSSEPLAHMKCTSTFGPVQVIPACLASESAMRTKAVRVTSGSSPRRPPCRHKQEAPMKGLNSSVVKEIFGYTK